MNMKRVLFTALVALMATLGAQSQECMNNALNDRQQCLLTIAALEAKGDIQGLTEALDEALDGPLTISEAKEALSQLYAYTGFPRSLNALSALQAVINERQEAGKTTHEGNEASALPAGYSALEQGTQVQRQLTGRGFDYAFAPATDYYLKAHLFGDIFARDNLSFADRELVTIGALSALEGVESQRRSHVAGSLNMGVTEEELRSVPATLADRVGATEAYRAALTVSEVLNLSMADLQGDGPAFIPQLTFPIGQPNTGYAQYFIGNSYLANVTTGGGQIPVNNVTFEPGCRNNWHIHHGFNQILICVCGDGWYQEWGKPAQALHPGDVIDIPDGVKHWHGAQAHSWFQHLTYHTPSENGSNEWLEPVDDDHYNALSQQ